ncbi:MAG: hypothetical protein IKL90_00570 [Alphaproteobacteria bacterium]|nr:hypothetical protein [Alphaproteobacteria bacterium]
MKKILFGLILFVVLSIFFISLPREKTEEIYVDIRGWSEPFQYYPKSKKLKGENDNFNVLKRTKNAFSIQQENELNLYYRLHYTEDEYELLSKSQLLDEKNKKIAVLTFSLDSDESKWKNFYETMENNFLPNHSKNYFVFTNSHELKVEDNVLKIAQYDIRAETLTLKKFHIFDKVKHLLKLFDYVYFVDMEFLAKSPVHEEILPTREQGFVTVLHPCYYDWKEGGFPYEKNEHSKAYVPSREGKFYVQNSFFGGTKDDFFELTDTIKKWVDWDLKKDIRAPLADESFLNKYVFLKMRQFEEPLILLPEFLPIDNFCAMKEEKKIDPDEIVLFENGQNQIYKFDSKTSVLKGENKDLPVARRTLSTISIPNEKGVTVYHRVYYSKNEYEPLTSSQVVSETPKNIAIITFVDKNNVSEWNKFYQTSKGNFLPNHQKKYFVFTNQKKLKVPTRDVKKILMGINDFELKKFHLINKIKDELSSFDYVYFMDANIDVVTKIGNEVLPTPWQEMVYAIHPWHYRWPVKNFPYERNYESEAYIQDLDGKFYVENAFFGGNKDSFLNLAQTIQKWIDFDLKRDIVPQWKDESYINKYLVERQKEAKKPLILTPEYVYPSVKCDISSEFKPYKKMILKTIVKDSKSK